MYLDPVSSDDISTRSTGYTTDDGDLKRQLWMQVQSAFPKLHASSLRLDETGGDHLLLIVDEARAIRFPRPGKHGMDLEINVLSRIRPHAQIALPDYDLIDPNDRFAGYPLIPGISLTPALLRSLSRDASNTILGNVVSVLKVLHGLSPEAVLSFKDWPRVWSAGQFAGRIEHQQMPLLANRLPVLSGLIPRFLNHYRLDQAPDEVVLHGDLVSDHVIIDQFTSNLTGIIDFSDVALGDPAHDLFGFWAYGTHAAAYAVKCYDPCDGDAGLLARSRNHFIRYCIDRLYGSIVDEARSETIERQTNALTDLLAS